MIEADWDVPMFVIFNVKTSHQRIRTHYLAEKASGLRDESKPQISSTAMMEHHLASSGN